MRTQDLIIGTAVPPKLDKDAPSGRINVIASETLLKRIDEWRAAQRPIPNKSEAARVLIEQALEAEDKRKGRE
jgi:metal-responsive CopG/Arc/MetJ family transcriptional regulator